MSDSLKPEPPPPPLPEDHIVYHTKPPCWLHLYMCNSYINFTIKSSITVQCAMLSCRVLSSPDILLSNVTVALAFSPSMLFHLRENWFQAKEGESLGGFNHVRTLMMHFESSRISTYVCSGHQTCHHCPHVIKTSQTLPLAPLLEINFMWCTSHYAKMVYRLVTLYCNGPACTHSSHMLGGW